MSIFNKLFSGLMLSFMCTSADATIDVIIVGAGMSGIAAAHQLQQQGLTVLILEARDRIGGRVWTDYAHAKPFELGAGWIHQAVGNPLTTLSEQFKLKTIPYDYDNAEVYDATGNALSDKKIDLIDTLENKFMRYLSRRQENDETDTSVAQIYQDYVVEQRLSSRDAYWLYYTLLSSIQYDYAGDLSQLSMTEFNQDSEFSGTDLVFPTGYSQLMVALAKGIPIKFNEVVTAIDYQSATVVVTTNHQRYQARYVLCTVPLGVLQKGRISFSPDLPLAKKRAMKKLAMGTLNRVYLQFPRVFWDKSVDEIHYIPAKTTRWLEIMNLYKINKNPALMAFVSGNQAEQMEGESDAEVVADLMHHLTMIYGVNIPQPTQYKITRWHSDPFSFGSYSFIKVNGDGSAYNALAQPINNRLFFAGEATEPQFSATVHGAYLSGLRAAKEIADVWHSETQPGR